MSWMTYSAIDYFVMYANMADIPFDFVIDSLIIETLEIAQLLFIEPKFRNKPKLTRGIPNDIFYYSEFENNL